MAKTKISQYDADPANNTDIDGINLAEGMAPGLVNNAIREMMAQLKDFQGGAVGDPLTVGGNLAVTGTSSFTGAITMSGRLVDALPTGTKMLFQQTAAPVGWVKDVTNDNKALRIVSGTAGTGGSVSFTTAFSSQNVGDTTLTIAQIPVHNHTFSGNTGGNNVGHSHAVNDPGHAHTYSKRYAQASGSGFPGFNGNGDAYVDANRTTAANVTGITLGNNNANHLHAYAGTTSNTGNGVAHNHSLNLAVQYVDVIVATKS